MIAVDITDLLVIDDDEDLRMLTRLTFQIHGWSVTTAPDGGEGLRRLRELVVGGAEPTVLLDIQMPEIDGWEVLRQIRADPELRHLAVVICTVRAGEEDRARGFALGADGFVSKPFDVDELVAEVSYVSALPRMQRAARRMDPPQPS